MQRVLMATLVLLAGCSSAPAESTSPTAASVQTTSSTTEVIRIPEQLDGFEVLPVEIGDRTLLLAVADSPSLRQQGLMGVTDLGSLDGMLFFWRHDGDAFWMKNTLIPLDIVWFNQDGSYKDRASMVPCIADPCPTHKPIDGLDFRYAIEANPGTLDWITPETTIRYSD